jgi:altronate dehydratase
MDLNAGAILDEAVSLAEMGCRIFEEILRRSSGMT